MIDERQQELASLYALDLLEGADRAPFEAEIATNPELQAFVRELRASATSLARTAPVAVPPTALRDRVLASATSRAASGNRAVSSSRSWSGGFPLPQLLPWALAASFAVAAAWLGVRYYTNSIESQTLAQQHALAEIALKTADARIQAEHIIADRVLADYATLKSDTARQLAAAHQSEADARTAVAALEGRLKRETNLARLKIATLASMLQNSPQALAVAVWDPAQQSGVLTVDRLPAIGADQRYELWVIDSKPVSAGVFTVGPDGRAHLEFKPVQPVAKAAKFAVSREKNDGVRAHAAPTDVVMISE